MDIVVFENPAKPFRVQFIDQSFESRSKDNTYQKFVFESAYKE